MLLNKWNPVIETALTRFGEEGDQIASYVIPTPGVKLDQGCPTLSPLLLLVSQKGNLGWSSSPSLSLAYRLLLLVTELLCSSAVKNSVTTLREVSALEKYGDSLTCWKSLQQTTQRASPTPLIHPHGTAGTYISLSAWAVTHTKVKLRWQR